MIIIMIMITIIMIIIILSAMLSRASHVLDQAKKQAFESDEL